MVVIDGQRPVRSEADEMWWAHLVESVDRQEVTPFLGAGVSDPPLPDARKLTIAMARKCGYPFRRIELMEVAQYWATTVEPRAPKVFVQQLFQRAGEVDLTQPGQPHALLAELPIPAFLTTNYDLFMEQALGPAARTEVLRWNSKLELRYRNQPMITDPTVQSPVVYHLHGSLTDPDTFVLTEDDYLDFMVNARRYQMSDAALRVIPDEIDSLIALNSMLFLGYSLRDWNLKVLLRTLIQNAERSAGNLNLSVQLEPNDRMVVKLGKEKAMEYLDQYFQGIRIRVYWGTLESFLTTLVEKWHAAHGRSRRVPVTGGRQ